MPKEDLTEIVVILDRSGSMESVRLQAIQGYNQFLGEHKSFPGQAIYTLAQFDDQYEIVLNGVEIQHAPDMDWYDFVPRGQTALYDAIGRTINEVEARHKKTEEALLPEKVIVAILADGQENASKEFSRDQVFALIQRQYEHASWEFVYIALGSEAAAAGSKIGVRSASVFSFPHSPGDTHNGFISMSTSISNYRTHGNLSGESSLPDINDHSVARMIKGIKKDRLLD